MAKKKENYLVQLPVKSRFGKKILNFQRNRSNPNTVFISMFIGRGDWVLISPYWLDKIIRKLKANGFKFDKQDFDKYIEVIFSEDLK
jgi:hypothetical protein